MSETNDYEEIVQSIINKTKQVSKSEKHKPEYYLQKHLIEIQDELDNEIVYREKFEQIIKLIFCQCTNYTLSIFFISLGMEIWISTLIGLFIGLIPGVEALLFVGKIKDDSLFKYVPVVGKIGVGLFTSAVVFTNVTAPQFSSQNTVKNIYLEIENVEYRKPQENGITQLQKSPVTPLLIALLIAVIYINFRKK